MRALLARFRRPGGRATATSPTWSASAPQAVAAAPSTVIPLPTHPPDDYVGADWAVPWHRIRGADGRSISSQAQRWIPEYQAAANELFMAGAGSSTQAGGPIPARSSTSVGDPGVGPRRRPLPVPRVLVRSKLSNPFDDWPLLIARFDHLACERRPDREAGAFGPPGGRRRGPPYGRPPLRCRAQGDEALPAGQGARPGRSTLPVDDGDPARRRGGELPAVLALLDVDRFAVHSRDGVLRRPSRALGGLPKLPSATSSEHCSRSDQSSGESGRPARRQSSTSCPAPDTRLLQEQRHADCACGADGGDVVRCWCSVFGCCG